MLYLLRHGQTEWNVKYKLQGQSDIPLNEVGRAEAKAACKKYADIHFDACYCSPLMRARETAALVLDGRDLEIIPDNRLAEMSFGIYEGFEHVLSTPDCPVYTLFHDPEAYEAVENGESVDDIFRRTGNFLAEVVAPAMKNGKDILIVGHGAMNSSIICQVQGLPRSRFLQEIPANCELTILDYQPN